MKGSLFSSRSPSPSHPLHTHKHASPSSTPPHHRHTFSETMTEESLDDAESIVRNWDLDAHKNAKFSPLFAANGDRREAHRFVEAVASLQAAMHYYVKIHSGPENLVRAQNLMRIAIKRLEKEFYVILSSNRKNLDSESVSSRSSRGSVRSSVSDYYEDEISEEERSTTPPRTPPRTPPPVSEAEKASDMAMVDLKTIADCMIAAGYGKECVRVYKLIRKSIVDETLYSLGVEKLTHSKMQKMDWNVLEAKIKAWLHTVTVAVKTLFHGERILCDVVFSSSERIAESCFTDISRDAAVNLFSFPENFGKSRKILSPEKMFRALDMYEAISELWPEIESVFSHESLSAVRSEAMAAQGKLAEAVRVMLAQFEAAIQKDSSKTPSGGGVHPLTRYVMNFLVFIADYSGAVTDIVAESPPDARSPLPASYFTSPTAGGGEDPSAEAITTRLAWLILVLLCKLDAKAVLYNDVALSYLFLANNLNYVVLKVRNSNLGILMGLDWIWNNRSKVNRYFANYERMGWSDVISSLPEDPTAEIAPEEVGNRFRKFNQGFEEAYKKQAAWVIPDPKARDEVKISLSKKIILPYRAFYQKHRGDYSRGVGGESIVRYAPEDLDNYLSDLFFATASGGSTTTSYGTHHGTSRGRSPST
ncbi:exocyst subunit exo70 family protein H7 [Striga asiatica]|uniref:Exocyst subunit Exo70 family protein n=1 Tax=Striga asiatica TaxID=4170 RepID=A0A5A7P973_STRAF|nr:exocyst subunit exo70 family protein H7 [Striga asiatica]